MRSEYSRRGFTLIELLVVIGILVILIGMLMPAVQKVREAAARTKCTNNMRQLAIGCQTYYAANNCFPPGNQSTIPGDMRTGCASSYGEPNLKGRASWSVLLLPHIEQQNALAQFQQEVGFDGLLNDVTSTVTGPAPQSPNVTFQSRSNPAFHCPSDPRSRSGATHTNYVAVQGGGATAACVSGHPFGQWYVNGVMFHNSRVRIEKIKDGTSNTALLGESRHYISPIDATGMTIGGQPVTFGATWASAARINGISSIPLVVAATADPLNSPLPGNYTRTFSSHHTGGIVFARCDGSILFVGMNVDLNVYRQFGGRDDGGTASIQ